MELDKPDKEMIKELLNRFEESLGEPLKHSHETLSGKLSGLNFGEIEDFFLDAQRKYVLSLPKTNIKKIIDRSLEELKIKYNLKN